MAVVLTGAVAKWPREWLDSYILEQILISLADTLDVGHKRPRVREGSRIF